MDGLADSCCFKQPLGICTEFESAVYVFDAQTNSKTLFTRMSSFASFLRAIGSLYDAFSVHSKGTAYTVKSLSAEHDFVQFCSNILHENELDIRSSENINGVLNGPHGHAYAETVSSVFFIEESIKHLRDILREYNYDSCNPLQLYESVYRKLPLHCPYKATQYADAGIRKVLWSNNEGKHQTPDSPGQPIITPAGNLGIPNQMTRSHFHR